MFDISGFDAREVVLDCSDLTIVIPAYNAAKTIADTLSSAAALKAGRLIVVDDGSSDDTSEIASTFENCEIIRQKNAGTAAARSAGLLACKTPYVAFLDADDSLMIQGVHRSLSLIGGSRDCVAVLGATRVVSPDGTSKVVFPWGEGVSVDSLLRRGISPAPPGSFIWRREALMESLQRKPEPLLPPYAEDYELLLRGAALGPILQHEVVVCKYALTGGKSSENPYDDNYYAEVLRGRYSEAYGVPIRSRSGSELRSMALLRNAFASPGRKNRFRRNWLYLRAATTSPSLAVRLLSRRLVRLLKRIASRSGRFGRS